MAKFVVLVCGGRDFKDFVSVNETLDKIMQEHTITLVVHGGSSGADNLGGAWAKKQNLPCAIIFPNWELYGKRAGPLRNIQMLDTYKPNLIVAFPGGPGTAHCVKEAKKRGLTVLEVPVKSIS